MLLDPLLFVLAASAAAEWRRQATACHVSPLAAACFVCELQQTILLHCQELSVYLHSTIREYGICMTSTRVAGWLD